MNRRSFLARGAGAIATASLAAGCLDRSGGGGGDVELPGSTPDPSISRAGLAPESEDVDVPGVDVDSLETTTTFEIDVPLLPIDIAYDWYRAQEVRFVDARSLSAYQSSHVSGAVHSHAPSGYDEDDPTNAWPDSERIVTYCTCPHHLSSQRAAVLIDDGHEAAFALDEGFSEWYDRDYPMGSSNGAVSLGDQRAITGRVDSAYAGELVWLRHEPTGQREPAEIAADGSFEVSFRFAEIDGDDAVVLETPAWTRTGTVAEFTDGTVR